MKGSVLTYGIVISKKENTKNESFYRDENYFNKHQIKKALCGKGHGEKISVKRIVVIQMK